MARKILISTLEIMLLGLVVAAQNKKQKSFEHSVMEKTNKCSGAWLQLCVLSTFPNLPHACMQMLTQVWNLATPKYTFHLKSQIIRHLGRRKAMKHVHERTRDSMYFHICILRNVICHRNPLAFWILCPSLHTPFMLTICLEKVLVKYIFLFLRRLLCKAICGKQDCSIL